MNPHIEHTSIGGTLRIPCLINGLWQLAGGHDEEVDIVSSAIGMDPLISAGLDCFDMADHYGDAELVIGQHNSSSSRDVLAFTKWCPVEDGDRSFSRAEAAVSLALARMRLPKIPLLQCKFLLDPAEMCLLIVCSDHVWEYTDDTYIHNLCHLRTLQSQGLIGHIGLTNVDAAHLELLLDSGFAVATNQVSCSVLDRRLERGRLGKICLERSVGVFAYGTLLGGFFSEKWLGRPAPSDKASLNWSLRKYLRFIDAAGGWDVFQIVLQALATTALKHKVSIAAVATRYVLDIPAVSAVIVGTRLSRESEKYIKGNLSVFSFTLDGDDRALIAQAQESLRLIPGDCGDEYRRPPFLTAAGDLSHHLKPSDQETKLQFAAHHKHRLEYASGSKWEQIAGYCRAVRTGSIIRVSGTTANSPVQSINALGGSSARSQAVAVLDIIERALKALGGSLSDVVRTRIMLRREQDCEAVSLAHGWAFQCRGIRPANTFVVAGLIGDEFLVEIEAEAELGTVETFSVPM